MKRRMIWLMLLLVGLLVFTFSIGAYGRAAANESSATSTAIPSPAQ